MSSKRYFEALSEAEDAPLSPRDSQTQSASKSTPSEAPASKKPRLADVDQSLTTLHVTNLSPSVDTPALASHFSNCGTLKSCFVVCEKNNGPSRGFGYVSFGDGKQAEQALKKLNGSLLAQGKISVGWAKRRQREGEGPTVTVTAKDVSKLDQQHADRKAARKAQAFHPATEDTDARLVVCVRGLNQALSPEADQEDAESLRKAMYKKVKKLAATIDKSVGTEDAQMQVKYPVEEIGKLHTWFTFSCRPS